MSESSAGAVIRLPVRRDRGWLGQDHHAHAFDVGCLAIHPSDRATVPLHCDLLTVTSAELRSVCEGCFEGGELVEQARGMELRCNG